MPVRNWKVRAVTNRATALGFRVAFVRKTFGPRHVQNRVLINGHRCQLMAEPCLNNNGEEVIDLRAPGNAWAKFLIYIPWPQSDNENLFYIVPSIRLRELPFTPAQLREYANAWSVLESGGARWRRESRKGVETPCP